MFKNQFQGNSFFELFSAQGSSPLINWKINGNKSNIEKIYNKDVKGFSYNLKNNGYISLPKDNKQSCHLIHPYLVLQIYIPNDSQFTLECGVTDVGGNKGRIVFSTSIKAIKYSAFHISLPLTIMKRDVWLNLCIDLENITINGFKEFNGLNYKMLNYIKIYSNCKLRRVFTMKYRPPDTTGDDDIIDIDRPIDSIPKNMQFNHGIQFINQILTLDRIKNYIENINNSINNNNDDEVKAQNKQKTNIKNNSSSNQPNIAFGRKILVPLPPPKHIKRCLLNNRNNNSKNNINENENNSNNENNENNEEKNLSTKKENINKKLVNINENESKVKEVLDEIKQEMTNKDNIIKSQNKEVEEINQIQKGNDNYINNNNNDNKTVKEKENEKEKEKEAIIKDNHTKIIDNSNKEGNSENLNTDLKNLNDIDEKENNDKNENKNNEQINEEKNSIQTNEDDENLSEINKDEDDIYNPYDPQKYSDSYLFTSNKDYLSEGWSKFGTSGVNDINLDNKQQLNDNIQEGQTESNNKDKKLPLNEKNDNYQYNKPLEPNELLTNKTLNIQELFPPENSSLYVDNIYNYKSEIKNNSIITENDTNKTENIIDNSKNCNEDSIQNSALLNNTSIKDDIELIKSKNKSMENDTATEILKLKPFINNIEEKKYEYLEKNSMKNLSNNSNMINITAMNVNINQQQANVFLSHNNNEKEGPKERINKEMKNSYSTLFNEDNVNVEEVIMEKKNENKMKKSSSTLINMELNNAHLLLNKISDDRNKILEKKDGTTTNKNIFESNQYTIKNENECKSQKANTPTKESNNFSNDVLLKDNVSKNEDKNDNDNKKEDKYDPEYSLISEIEKKYDFLNTNTNYDYRKYETKIENKNEQQNSLMDDNKKINNNDVKNVKIDSNNKNDHDTHFNTSKEVNNDNQLDTKLNMLNNNNNNKINKEERKSTHAQNKRKSDFLQFVDDVLNTDYYSFKTMNKILDDSEEEKETDKSKKTNIIFNIENNLDDIHNKSKDSHVEEKLSFNNDDDNKIFSKNNTNKVDVDNNNKENTDSKYFSKKKYENINLNNQTEKIEKNINNDKTMNEILLTKNLEINNNIKEKNDNHINCESNIDNKSNNEKRSLKNKSGKSKSNNKISKNIDSNNEEKDKTSKKKEKSNLFEKEINKKNTEENVIKETNEHTINIKNTEENVIKETNEHTINIKNTEENAIKETNEHTINIKNTEENVIKETNEHIINKKDKKENIIKKTNEHTINKNNTEDVNYKININKKNNKNSHSEDVNTNKNNNKTKKDELIITKKESNDCVNNESQNVIKNEFFKDKQNSINEKNDVIKKGNGTKINNNVKNDSINEMTQIKNNTIKNSNNNIESNVIELLNNNENININNNNVNNFDYKRSEVKTNDSINTYKNIKNKDEHIQLEDINNKETRNNIKPIENNVIKCQDSDSNKNDKKFESDNNDILKKENLIVDTTNTKLNNKNCENNLQKKPPPKKSIPIGKFRYHKYKHLSINQNFDISTELSHNTDTKKSNINLTNTKISHIPVKKTTKRKKISKILENQIANNENPYNYSNNDQMISQTKESLSKIEINKEKMKRKLDSKKHNKRISLPSLSPTKNEKTHDDKVQKKDKNETHKNKRKDIDIKNKEKNELNKNEILNNRDIKPNNIPSNDNEVELVFDPVLNSYFDPKDGKYYEIIN